MTSTRTPFLLLLLWAVWLSAESWVFGPHSYLHLHDQADQEVPNTVWLTQSVDRVCNAELMPSLCGVARKPSTAWINSAQPLFLTLPPWLALGVFTFLQRLAGGWFAFRIARDLFRIPPLLALAAGLVYPLLPCEHGEVRLMHQFNEPGLPFLVWAFARMPVARLAPAAFCGVGLGVFAGLGMGPVDAMPFFLPAALLMAVVLRTDLDHRRAWIALGVALAACLGVAILIKLPTLLALAEHARLSHRAAWQAPIGFSEALRLHAAGRLKFLVSFWPLTLRTVPFLARLRRRRREDLAVLLLLAASLVLGPLLQSAAWRLGDTGVLIRALDFSRFNRLAPLALLLAGFSGLRNLLDRRVPVTGTPGGAALPAVFSFVAGIAALASWNLKSQHWADMRGGWTWHSLYGGADVKALTAKARQPGVEPFRCATAGAYHGFHPLYLIASGLETADGYAVVYPDRYRKYWAQVLRPLLSAEPASAGYFTAWGSRVYLFHSMAAQNASLPELPFAAWYDLDLLSLANVRYLVSQKPLAHPRLVPLPSAWDAAARDAWAEKPARAKLADYLAGRNPGPRQYVYENPSVFPRFFLAEGTHIIDTPDALGDATLEELRNSVFLLRGDADGLAAAAPAPDPPGAVKVDSYSLETSTLTVTVARPCWLVNTSLWYPRNRCEADGKPLRILPAYGAFQAVRLEPGGHHVRWNAMAE